MIRRLKKLFHKDFKYKWVKARMLIGPKRTLPDFLIIGAMKSGTSSLFHFLNRHPSLNASIKKEIEFYSKDNFYSKGEHWYRSFFIKESTKLKKNVLAYEACPHYLHEEMAPERIKHLQPNVKMIVLLRNPVDRAISHYFHYVRNGNEFREPELALTEKENNVYKIRSHYADQLNRYLKHFSEKQILIMKSEDFFQETLTSLGEVYSFLGVDNSIKLKNLKPYNIGGYENMVSNDIIEHLVDYFEPQLEQLKILTDGKIVWH